MYPVQCFIFQRESHVPGGVPIRHTVVIDRFQCGQDSAVIELHIAVGESRWQIDRSQFWFIDSTLWSPEYFGGPEKLLQERIHT